MAEDPVVQLAAKKLINAPENIVNEVIEGLVNTNPDLMRIAGQNVVIRSDYQTVKAEQVSLISGGGSGHEPAHAGYVGAGMLTAAVCGGVFASPSVSEILAAIRTVTGPKGCLLIIKNYTGDRLNFGIAAEQAKSEGFKVDMVIVGEDCALPPSGNIPGRRGLAGTCFVHKAAGATAAAGGSLEEVVAIASSVASSVGTMGVSLHVCTLPGTPKRVRLEAQQIELGLGIHGEPGATVVPAASADSVVDSLLGVIAGTAEEGNHGYLTLAAAGSRVVLMLNNLGGTPPLEIAICVRRAQQWLAQRGHSVERVLSGPFMTSLDMAGMSISVLLLPEEEEAADAWIALLDADTAAAGWPRTTAQKVTGCREVAEATAAAANGECKDGAAAVVPLDDSAEAVAWRAQLSALVTAAANAVIAVEDDLTEFDNKVGDGDCGITMTRGGQALLAAVASFPTADVSALLCSIADTIRDSMGGSSGALMDIFFRAAGASLRSQGANLAQPSFAAAAAAYAAGLGAMQKYGGARPGDRTMIDALHGALAPLQAADNAVAGAAAAAAGAAEGVEATKTMRARAGRGTYVPVELTTGVPDPGAVAVATVWTAIANTLAQ